MNAFTSTSDGSTFDRLTAAAWADVARAVADARVDLEAVSVGDGTLLTSTEDPSPLFNRLIGWGSSGAARPDVLDEAIERCRRRGIDRFFVHVVRGHPRCVEATEMLRARGFVPYRRGWVELSRGRSETVPPPAGRWSVRACTKDDAAAFGLLMARAFDLAPAGAAAFAALVERPRWTTCCVRHDGRLIGGGASFIHDGCCYLAGGATDSAHRRAGVQYALLHHRVVDALERGCQTIASETGEAVPGDPQHSHRNMERLGLVPVCVRDNWLPTPDSPA